MKTYIKSGKFSWLVFVYFLLVALFVFPILSYAYVYATWYMPLIYVNFLFWIWVSFALAFVLNYVAKWGKVRNTWVAITLWVLGVTLFLYMSWAVWMTIALSEVLWDLYMMDYFISPVSMFLAINEINKVWVWDINGHTVSGWILWLVWILEAWLIWYFTLWWMSSILQLPYSEKLRKWFDGFSMNFTVESIEKMFHELHTQNTNFVWELTRVESEPSNSHVVLTVHQLDGEDDAYVSAVKKLANINEKWELKFDEVSMFTNIWVPDAVARNILRK